MSVENCYRQGRYMWFPRRNDCEQDIGVRSSSIYMIEDKGEYSLVMYEEGVLRAYNPANKIAQTLWGKGKYKEPQKGVFMRK